RDYKVTGVQTCALPISDRVVYLQDRQLCVLTPDEWQILDPEKTRVEASVEAIEWEAADADKGVFDHFMLKEIHEQPEALENAMRSEERRVGKECGSGRW